MQFRKRMIPLVLTAAFTGVSGWAVSLPHGTPAHAKRPSETQSASGKVKSVSGDSFSIEALKGQDSDVISFVTTGSTKVEGKLAVGSNATVEYRAENGKNVALHVVVESATQ